MDERSKLIHGVGCDTSLAFLTACHAKGLGATEIMAAMQTFLAATIGGVARGISKHNTIEVATSLMDRVTELALPQMVSGLKKMDAEDQGER